MKLWLLSARSRCCKDLIGKNTFVSWIMKITSLDILDIIDILNNIVNNYILDNIECQLILAVAKT